MQHDGPSKTVRIRLSPTTLRTLAKLSDKTWLSRNNVIRYAIARLAEREGVSIGESRAAARRTSVTR